MEDGKYTTLKIFTVEKLKTLGTLRDGILITVSIVYILGYLTWSLSAFRNNLGALPAIDAQYFVAGVIPFLLLVGVYVLLRILAVVKNGLRNWLTASNSKRSDLFWIMMMIIGLLATVVLFSLTYPFWVLPLILLPVSFWDLLAPQNRVFQIVALVYTFLVPILLGIIVFWLYLGLVYPAIPVEFGGVRPRCASLAVNKELLSHETLSLIISQDKLKSVEHVVHTSTVDVYFSGSNFLLVKPHSANSSTIQGAIEIPKTVISGITWCD